MITVQIENKDADDLCSVSLERIIMTTIQLMEDNSDLTAVSFAIDDLESIKKPLLNIVQAIRQARDSQL